MSSRRVRREGRRSCTATAAVVVVMKREKRMRMVSSIVDAAGDEAEACCGKQASLDQQSRIEEL